MPAKGGRAVPRESDRIGAGMGEAGRGTPKWPGTRGARATGADGESESLGERRGLLPSGDRPQLAVNTILKFPWAIPPRGCLALKTSVAIPWVPTGIRENCPVELVTVNESCDAVARVGARLELGPSR